MDNKAFVFKDYYDFEMDDNNVVDELNNFFYDELFKSFSKTDNNQNSSAKIKNDEEKRLTIIRDMLNNKKGVTELNAKLIDAGLRGLYTLNPIDMILYFCLKSNETDGSFKKYDFYEFKKLYDSLNNTYEKYFNPKSTHCPFGNTITFGDLYEFLQNSSESSSERFETANPTMLSKNKLEKIDYTSENAENELSLLYIDCATNFTYTQKTAGFYFVKYCYFLIESQILDLKNVLLRFANMSDSKALECIRETVSEPDYNTWGIEYGFFENEKFEKYYYAEIKQPSKIILGSILKNFVLKGSSTKKDSWFKLLTSQDKELSEIKEKTFIFTNAKKKDQHNEIVEKIKTMKPSDFYGYAIDLEKLYHFAFEKLMSKNEAWLEEATAGINDFMKGILCGEHYLSRGAFILFLASMKAGINSEIMQNATDTLYTEKDVLNYERVCSIIKRACYVPFENDDYYRPLDALYYMFFNPCKPKSINELSSDFSTSVSEFVEKYNINPIPYEIDSINAACRSKQLIE